MHSSNKIAGSTKMNDLSPTILPGVIVGDEVSAIYGHARANQYALPAVNVVSTTSILSLIHI